MFIPLLAVYLIGCGPSPGPGRPPGERFQLRVPFPCGVRVKIHCSYGPRCTGSHNHKHHKYRTNDYYAVDMSRDERGNGRGKPLVAAAAGEVLKAGWTRRGWSPYGKIVYLQHAGGYQTLYAHMERVSVRPGQRVKAGDVIGALGGSSRGKLRRFGPHLHFALTRGARRTLGGGRAIKPEPMGGYRRLRSGMRMVACEPPSPARIAALGTD